MGLQPLELEVFGQLPAEFSQPCQKIAGAECLVDLEDTLLCDMNFDAITFLEPQRLDNRKIYLQSAYISKFLSNWFNRSDSHP
jgi:hypothetical protein